mmetsp:Transcript_3870/g.10648  ORF Transcript_3870/g.10648 Transcript_3870/m.10648 type:complete len:234 (-) Transcript_3870:51-752(-)
MFLEQRDERSGHQTDDNLVAFISALRAKELAVLSKQWRVERNPVPVRNIAIFDEDRNHPRHAVREPLTATHRARRIRLTLSMHEHVEQMRQLLLFRQHRQEAFFRIARQHLAQLAQVQQQALERQTAELVLKQIASDDRHGHLIGSGRMRPCAQSSSRVGHRDAAEPALDHVCGAASTNNHRDALLHSLSLTLSLSRSLACTRVAPRRNHRNAAPGPPALRDRPTTPPCKRAP